MYRFFKQLLVPVVVLVAIAGASATSFQQAGAINVFKTPSPEQTGGAGVVNNQGGMTFEVVMQRVISIMFIIVGIASVIMIIIGGIRYTTSNGEQSQIQSAKNTIMYAVIGLVISIMAIAIVNFVVGVF